MKYFRTAQFGQFLSLTSCSEECYNQDMKKHNLYRGFTIIEVVLVLAIAGLIFIMIFLGLPVLQRSQRNEQRKRDMGEIAGAIQNYRSANKGRMPESFESIKPYIRQDIRDPDGDEYDIEIDRYVTYGNMDTKNRKAKFEYHIKTYHGKTQVRIHKGSRCAEDEGYIYHDVKEGHAAVTFRLESGDGSTTQGGHYYCLDI